MSKETRLLRAILRIAGSMMLTATLAVIMPTESMQAIHRWIGLGEMPEGSIVEYLARSVSLFYAFHGAILLFIANDLRRYLGFFKFYLYLSYPFAIGLLFVDLLAGMPVRWTLLEAPPVLVLITLLLILSRRVEESRHEVTAGS